MKPTEPKPTQLTQTLTLLSGAGVKPQGRELEKQIVDKILGEGYDKRIRPSGINNKTGQNGKRATLAGRIQVQTIALSYMYWLLNVFDVISSGLWQESISSTTWLEL